MTICAAGVATVFGFGSTDPEPGTKFHLELHSKRATGTVPIWLAHSRTRGWYYRVKGRINCRRLKAATGCPYPVHNGWAHGQLPYTLGRWLTNDAELPGLTPMRGIAAERVKMWIKLVPEAA
jgi:hypothetical protein